MSDPVQAFLDTAGWSTARHIALAGDASSRRYWRLIKGAGSAVLMDATSETDAQTQAFIRVAEWLKTCGFSAPKIIAQDRGLILLEDLGDALFAKLVQTDPLQERPLYAAAARFLADLHQHPVPDWLEPYSAETLGQMTQITLDHYLPLLGTKTSSSEIPNRITEAAQTYLGDPHVTCLRDFHAENLIWLPKRDGTAQVGLLDFQDAFAGHPAYDLVSLLQDARRDVSDDAQTRTIRLFCDLTGQDEASFTPAYALLGAQRNLRILGIFARLAQHMGKPHYLRLIPRVWGHVQRNLMRAELAPLAKAVQSAFPNPSPDALRRIEDTCRNTPSR